MNPASRNYNSFRLLEILSLIVFASITAPACAQHMDHKMIMDAEGMVMNWNDDELPRGCAALAGDEQWTVRVGTQYAEPGMTYGFDQYEWRVAPCTRVTVTLVNDDRVRHQWMVHGLPRYLYPQGMFHLEVNGGYQKKATFIVPGGDSTFLVHCDIAQHMETGLKGQIVVGSGAGDLPSVPQVSAPRIPDRYGENTALTLIIAAALGCLAAVLAMIWRVRT